MISGRGRAGGDARGEKLDERVGRRSGVVIRLIWNEPWWSRSWRSGNW